MRRQDEASGAPPPWPVSAGMRRIETPRCQLRGSKLISWPAAITGALVGTYSHIFLDRIMHSDMQPFAPLSEVNALLHLISVGGLHLLYVLCGAFGALLMFAVFFVRGSAHPDREA